MRNARLLAGMKVPGSLVPSDDAAVIAALRTMERPVETPTSELVAAALLIADRSKVSRYALVPFEADLHVELSNRLWSATWAAWDAGQDDKVLAMLQTWITGTTVWGTRGSDLMAVLSSAWETDEKPSEVALVAMRLWLWGEGDRGPWFSLSLPAMTAWIQHCPDDAILRKLTGSFLMWCKGMSCRHWHGLHVHGWAGVNDFRRGIRDPALVNAVVAVLPRIYPARSASSLANTERIVRKTVNNLWRWDDLSVADRQAMCKLSGRLHDYRVKKGARLEAEAEAARVNPAFDMTRAEIASGNLWRQTPDGSWEHRTSPDAPWLPDPRSKA